MSGQEWLYEPDELAAIDGWRPDASGSRGHAGITAGRRRSASGALVASVMLGLRDVLEPPRDEAAVVVEAPGEPDEPSARVALHFDPESPQETVAVVRR